MDMYDGVTPGNIATNVPAVMWPMDGTYAPAWAQALAGYTSSTGIQYSNLADPSAPVFDLEQGEADADQVATACVIRLGRGEWSVIYLPESYQAQAVTALARKSVSFTPASSWPAPGVYLHAADPTGVAHIEVAWAVVQPLAVQDRWLGGYDVSSTYGNYPGLPGSHGLAGPSPTEDDMTDLQNSMLEQIFAQLPDLVAKTDSTYAWVAGFQPALVALVAGQGPAIGAIAAAIIAGLPDGVIDQAAIEAGVLAAVGKLQVATTLKIGS